MATWLLTTEKTLSRKEILCVLADLHRRSRRSINSRMNLIVFRLATCAGLRASEIVGLTLDDVRADSTRPHLRIRKAIAKGGKARTVPLVFDRGTLADLRDWKRFRESQGASGAGLFVCSQTKRSFSRPIDRRGARMRFKVACRSLGRERVGTLTIHHGRHSFISHALHAGRSVVEVQQAAGHTSLGTTTRYAHVLAQDDGEVGDLFGA